jgi:hypothetical protein
MPLLPPPLPKQCAPPAAHIKEVTKANILQVTQITQTLEQDPSKDSGLDIFQVFAAEKKKHDSKVYQPTKLAKVPLLDQPPAPLDSHTMHPMMQYRYHSNAEDQQLASKLYTWLLEGKLSLATPTHILATSPTIRKELAEKLKVRRVETNLYERPPDSMGENDAVLPFSPLPCITNLKPVHSLPLLEIEVLVGGCSTKYGILDPGLQIIIIHQDLAEEVGAFINTRHHIEMEGANGTTNWMVGCTEYLTMQVGGVLCKVHTHIVEDTPFKLLLGRPFGRAVSSTIEDLPNGDVKVSIRDPTNPGHRIHIPMRPRKGHVASVKVLSVVSSPSNVNGSVDSLSSLDAPRLPVNTVQHMCNSPSVPQPWLSLPPPDTATFALAYKKVANKVRPVAATLPENFCNIHRIPIDPLLSLTPLPTHPPDFTPGKRLTQECLNALGLNADGFLQPEEEKLLLHVLKANEKGLAWTEEEKGWFSDEYFTSVKIPVIEHIPWAHKNLPIPAGILQDVINIFKDKSTMGVYKHSDASYHSRWFCVKKKSSTLHLIHNLQPLNTVTICNSGITPIADQVIEAMAGWACYSMLNLFVGYDHRMLDIASRDLTTIQSPISIVRLTCLPQGWTNAGAIFHKDVTFILEPEIRDVTWPFMDNCSTKGPMTRYEAVDSRYETNPTNLLICRFIWEHLTNVHHILHRLRCAGTTISAKKLFVAVPEVVILEHKCTYEGCMPDDSKMAKIHDWPPCKNVTDIRAFLGIMGYMRIWIKNYSTITCPLHNLTHKNQPFVWNEEHITAMQALKNAIVHSSALITIDYEADRVIYLAVDSSI